MFKKTGTKVVDLKSAQIAEVRRLLVKLMFRQECTLAVSHMRCVYLTLSTQDIAPK